MKHLVALAIGASLTLSASAFTLDFTGNIGATVPPDLTINVPGYGDVRFTAGFSSNLEVGSAYKNDDGSAAVSLQFVESESVTVTFLGPQPLSVDFDYVGLGSGEAYQTFKTGPQTYFVALQGTGDGAGIEAVSFTAVPEPSVALLGILGTLGLVIRRRR